MSGLKFESDAVGELFAMLLSALTVLVMWIGFRLPDAGMETLMGAMFVSSAVFYIADPSARNREIFAALLFTGALQFGIAMLFEQKFLLLIYMFTISYMMVRYYHDRRVAVIVVAMCCLTLTRPHGFEAGMNRWILFMLQAPFMVVNVALARHMFPVRHAPSIDYPPPGFFPALQFAVMMSLALFIYKFFQLPYGDWLIYSVALVHAGGVFGTAAIDRAAVRFFFAPLGMWVAFLFTALTAWFDYRMAYLAAVFAGLGFFFSRCYNTYAIYSMFFVTFFVLMFDMGFNWNNADFSMLDLVSSRLICITIGMGISILAEPLALWEKVEEDEAVTGEGDEA